MLNVYWHNGIVTRKDRESLNGHRGLTVWFTGLSASGKSTLAVEIEKALYKKSYHTYILDGDNIRHGLNKNLGFSPEDRIENIRRVGETAKLFTDCGIINLVAFISPYINDRRIARSLSNKDSFIEVFVDCPISVCEERDPKGVYKKVREGNIKSFTGIDSPYEPPINPEIHLRTDINNIKDCVNIIMEYIENV